MNFLKINPVRFLIATVMGVLVIFSNAIPAMAIGGTSSKPSEGTTQLQNIQKRTDRLANADKPAPSMKESQSKTKNGLNEVQGTANKDKMISPDDAENATTVREEVGSFLENLTGNS